MNEKLDQNIYLQLFDTMTLGIVYQNANGEIISANPAAQRILGVTFDQLRGRDSYSSEWRIIHEDGSNFPGDTHPAMQALKTGEKIENVVMGVYRPVDKKYCWVNVSAIPEFQNDASKPFRVYTILNDITDQKNAREALKRSKRVAETYLNLVAEIIVSLDLEGKIVLMNDSGHKLLGYEKDALIGKNWFETCIPIDVREEIRKVFHQSVSGDLWKTKKYENTVITKQGKEKIICWHNTLLSDDQGMITGVLSSGEDITERKKIEQILKRKEKEYRTLLESLPLGIFRTHSDGHVLYFNSALLHVIGCSSEEEARRKFQDLANSFYVDPARRGQFLQLLKEFGYVRNFEFEAKKVDGSYFWLSMDARISERFDDENFLIDGFTMDITDRKKFEEDLRQSEKSCRALQSYLTDIIDSMPSILIGIDPQRFVTQLNRSAGEFLGVSAEDSIQQSLYKVFPEVARFKSKIDTAFASQKTQHVSKARFMLDNRVQYYDFTVFPLISDEASGAVIRLDDVTDKMRMEQMMIQSEKMLSLGGLAAGMAHEINNPLSGITMNIDVINTRVMNSSEKNIEVAKQIGVDFQMIQQYLKERDIDDMLGDVKSSALRASQIVKDMLGFVRKDPKAKNYCHVTDLLDMTLELAGKDFDLEKKTDFRKIRIVREYEDNVPPVICEPVNIQQVFFNILKNGAESMHEKHYPDGGPQFILRIFKKDDCVRVEIEDNGIGLSEENKKRIFEPFYTTKGFGKGTGLGMSISYFIITEYHRGAMDIDSIVGEWTRVGINFPLAIEKEHL